MTKNLLILIWLTFFLYPLTVVPLFAETVTGKVEVVGEYGIKPRSKLDEQIKAERALIISRNGGITNAFVSIKSINGTPLLKNNSNHSTMIIDQKKKTFVPHVLPITVGTTVTLKNSDLFVHRIISNSETKRIRMEFAYEGATMDVTFDEPGIVDIWCDDHKRMQAWILVVETPYFAVTDEKGLFTIPNVPHGKYIVEVWHEVLGTQSQEITVGNEKVRVNFELPGKVF